MIVLDVLALHMLGDYILQNEWMAQHKLSDFRVRFVHVAVYGASFMLWRWYFFGELGGRFSLAVMATHFVIDSYRFAENHPYPPKSILIDQSLHIITLAILVRLFFGGVG